MVEGVRNVAPEREHARVTSKTKPIKNLRIITLFMVSSEIQGEVDTFFTRITENWSY
jgi:hypothetical protein